MFTNSLGDHDSIPSRVIPKTQKMVLDTDLLNTQHYKWPSRLGLQNTPAASLQRGKTPFNECSGYDTKQSDGEAPVMLVLWGMRNTSLLLLLPGPLCPRVVAPDRVLSKGRIELNCGLMRN